MMYRFLCCSDTHGKAPPALDETNATAWLHAGDVYNGWTPEPPPPRDLMAELPEPDLIRWRACAGVAAWLHRPIPVYAVRGNHDGHDLQGFFWKCDDLTTTVRRVSKNLLIAGLGWTGEHFSDLPSDADMRDACEVVAREVHRQERPTDRLIVLSHYPASFLPAERGYGSIHELVFDLAPMALVAGHNKDWFGRVEEMDVLRGHTLAIHPGPAGGTLDLDTDSGIATWHGSRARLAG